MGGEERLCRYVIKTGAVHPRSNQLLSETRAKTVKQFLVAKYDFIPPTMVESLGYGAQRPIAPNDTPENKQLNRRIEVIVWD